MRMNIRASHFLIFLLTPFVFFAQQISDREATDIAVQVLGKSVKKCGQGNQVKNPVLNGDKINPLSTYDIFTGEDGNGFVIVSMDRRAPKVIGYGGGKCDPSNLPPQLAAILAKQDSVLNSDNTLSEHPSWRKAAPSLAAEGGHVLETVPWGQGYPYNMYAPVIDDEKCPSGCVATAMAIVMKYNNWPDKGRGHHKWMTNGSYIEYDFDNTPFDYSLMLDSYSSGTFNDRQAEEVAKLMQAAGAGVNMQYDLEGSGAMTAVVGHYMHEFFRYSPECQFISTANFGESEWLDIIHWQIDSDHPIIMNGYSDSMGGHAFVCDGYSSDNLLHINWGWDGYDNGYYDPFFLGGFNYSIGMVINLFNDGNDKEYARCWNDYGYLWANSGIGVGFNVSVENIEKDKPFDALVGHITFPNDFSGSVCLALVDENEDIIEVCEPVGHSVSPNYDWDYIGYTWSGTPALPFRNVLFTNDIDESMRVQAVAREDGGDWKIILGTIEAPSSIKPFGNHLYVSRMEWEIHDPYNLTEVIYQNDNQNSVMFGDTSPFEVKVHDGVAYVLIDGIFRTNGSDFTPCDYNFDTTKEDYKIEIFANRYEDLLTRKVTLDHAGDLSSKIPVSEQPLIYDLTVVGPMNADDYAFITSNLYSLKYLDVYDTTVEESIYNRKDFLPETAGCPIIDDPIGGDAWGLESIRLPKGLKGFEAFSMPHSGIEFLEIPASVEIYEWSSAFGSKLNVLKVNNPTPVYIPEDTGALGLIYDGIYRNNTILYVPVGSLEAYKQSPSWRGFKEIRESDVEFKGKYVDVDDVRYLIVSDYALASGIYTHGVEAPYYVAPKDIEFEGIIYPVKGNCFELTTDCIYLSETEHFEFNIPYQYMRIASAITPFINAHYSGGTESTFTTLYVPGASSSNYVNSGLITEEMWKYKLDKEKNLLMIEPKLYCDINVVCINGESIEPYSDYIYAVKDIDNLTVDITFTTFGHDHVMTTHYSQEFNSGLESESLSIPVNYIDLSCYSAYLRAGEALQLEAYLFPETTTEKELEWISSDESVASVSAGGLVTAHSMGETSIIARSVDRPEVFVTCIVNVTSPRFGDSDGNGVVDSNDAVVISNYYLGVIDENSIYIEVSDINGDGVIDTQDALLILNIFLETIGNN